jgi:hypothetical protein
MAAKTVHVDPEFETFTYGDPTPPKRSLRTLNPGDFLAFYCGLQEWDDQDGWSRSRSHALYLAGYFEVELVRMGSELDADTRKLFANNFHVRYPSVFEEQKDGLVLVKGRISSSRLFHKAHVLSAHAKDRAGKPTFILSPSMREMFGELSGQGVIKRSNPRWINPQFSERAIRFLQQLE